MLKIKNHTKRIIFTNLHGWISKIGYESTIKEEKVVYSKIKDIY